MDRPCSCNRRPNCRYGSREVGGGRATRQPGQVRKEAALTSPERVIVPASRLSAVRPLAAASLTARCRAGETRARNRPDGSGGHGASNGRMSEAGTDNRGKAAGGYRVLARKYRPADFLRPDRPGADGAHPHQRIFHRPHRAGLDADRRARCRQDDHRAHPRAGAELQDITSRPAPRSI